MSGHGGGHGDGHECGHERIQPRQILVKSSMRHSIVVSAFCVAAIQAFEQQSVRVRRVSFGKHHLVAVSTLGNV